MNRIELNLHLSKLRVNDVRYRLSKDRRTELESSILNKKINQLGENHLEVRKFKKLVSLFRDYQIVNIAKVHKVRRYRLLKERLQSLKDPYVGEVALTQWLCLQRSWIPWKILRLLLTFITSFYTDWRKSLNSEIKICPYLFLNRWPVINKEWERWRLGPSKITTLNWGFRIILCCLCIYADFNHPSGISLAALSGSTVWEVRTAGLDTNGGGFVTGASGTDYSQQDSKNTVGNDISTTDAVSNGTTTLTSATATFQTSIIGNIIYFQGGTGSIAAVWKQCTARATTVSITIDSSIAASTGMTMNIGGALLTTGFLGARLTVAGMEAYIKSGTYTITSASTNIAGGCLLISVLPASVAIIGYGSSRGDLGTKPLIQASGISTFTLIRVVSTRCIVNNLEVDGATLTSSRGLVGQGLVFNCKSSNCTNHGMQGETSSNWQNCVVTGCSTQEAFSALSSNTVTDFASYSNTSAGVVADSSGCIFVRCISSSNSGGTTDGFIIPTSVVQIAFINCVSYGNGRDGFQSADSTYFENCIAEGNAGVGFKTTGANVDYTVLKTCAGYNNTGGNTSFTGTAPTYTLNTGFITLSASPFTNAGSGDFSLNNNAGGGTSVRAAGFPGVMQFGGTGYIDVGALQHQETAGGGVKSYIG